MVFVQGKDSVGVIHNVEVFEKARKAGFDCNEQVGRISIGVVKRQVSGVERFQKQGEAMVRAGEDADEFRVSDDDGGGNGFERGNFLDFFGGGSLGGPVVEHQTERERAEDDDGEAKHQISEPRFNEQRDGAHDGVPDEQHDEGYNSPNP